MKAGQLSQALTLAAELGRIKGMIAAAERDEMMIMVGRLAIGAVMSSDHVLADPALIASLKIDVLPYLQRRRRALEDSLRELGVDPD